MPAAINTDTETIRRLVRSIVATADGTDRSFDDDTDFFTLGFDSIQFLVLLSKIERECQVEIGVADLFQHPSVNGLARVVEVARRG